MIILTNIFVIIGSLISIIEDDKLICLFIGRAIYGLSSGAFAVYCPKYISEVTPIEIKGPIGGLS